MPQDFSHQNLRGRNFKGLDLTGANFSYAHIQGANFSNAILRGANFTKAKAGLQHRWAAVIVIAAILLASSAGFFAAIAAFSAAISLLGNDYVKSLSIFPGAVALSFAGINVAIQLNQQRFTALPDAIARVITLTMMTAGALSGVVGAVVAVYGNGTVTTALAGLLIGGLTAALDLCVQLTMSAVTILAGVVPGFLVPILTLTGALIGAKFLVGDFSGAVVMLLLIAIAPVLQAVYVVRQGIFAGDENVVLTRTIAIALASIRGTSFKRADLTAADFTKATLQSTDFTESIITHTCFYKAQKLNLARVGNSILANQAVFNLLISGNGRHKSYIGANLRGANLIGADLKNANLKQADIAEATFQGANLEEATLTLTQAIGTDFSNANMTGACVEAWNIDSTTKLDKVDCRYVYLLENPNPITGYRERRPHDPDKVFEPGDFEKLYKKIMNTVQILLRNGINTEAFIIAFRKLMEDQETTDNSISIDRKGNDVLLTIEVSEDTDKGKVQRNFEEVYYEARLYEARLEAQKNAELLEAERLHGSQTREIASKLANIGNLLSNITVIASGANTIMTDNKNQRITTGTSSFVNTGEMNNMTGSTINLGEISGNVTNAVNRLPDSSETDKPGIKELLTELQAAIEEETDLSDEDKAEALEQVKALAEASKNPQEASTQKSAKTAMKILKGTVAGLPSVATLAEACSKLLPLIAKFLGLPI